MANQIIYLVRHGETAANLECRTQGFDEPLSETGHKQAEVLAERCADLKFDSLISSDMIRTKETTEKIAKKTNCQIIFEPLFREVTRPTVIQNISHDSAEYKKFIKDEKNHLDDPNSNWNYADGEFFETIAKRSLDALTYLENRPEERLLVVSHGLFIRYLTATILIEKKLTANIWKHLSLTMQMHNTGITIFKRELETNHWSLRTWNDHAHFAE